MTDQRPRVYDTARAIRQRARTRALERLRQQHPAEYRILLNEELKKAAEEVAAIEAIAKKTKPPRSATVVHRRSPGAHPQPSTPPTALVPEPAAPAVLLRRGPNTGQALEERIRMDVAECPWCAANHDRGHKCPMCGNEPQIRPGVPVGKPKRKWEQALDRDLAAAAEAAQA